MIEVVFTPQCKEIMDLLEISRNMVVTTVNDRHRALVDTGLTRMAAVHWFSETQIVFVDAAMTGTDIDEASNRISFREVTAHIVLDLQSDLPGGSIDHEMNMEEILQVIATSFGQPLTCHPQQEPKLLYSGPWDGKGVEVEVEINNEDEGETTIGVCGSFSAEEDSCSLVWAFNLERYRTWFVGS